MRISYYILRSFSNLFAFIPFWAIYIISYKFYLLFYYLIPYRKKIIRQNIERSFPDLDKSNQIKIIKGFYHNLSDIFIEAIKGFSISEKSLLKRYKFLNPEIMNDLYDKGEDIIAVGSHYANWEWGILAAPLQLKHKIFAFYTPLSNKPIDTYLRKKRQNWGTHLIASNTVKDVFNRKHDKPVCYFFGADQSPKNTKGVHWMKFLNQDTACIKGPEIFARRNHLKIVYFDVQRVKKGYYTVALKIIADDPRKTNAGDITEKYMHTLEQIIIHKPEDFLWSHRRWKHSRNHAL
jgi:KDO2-lipid IV(A) lauroyltransferase